MTRHCDGCNRITPYKGMKKIIIWRHRGGKVNFHRFGGPYLKRYRWLCAACQQTQHPTT